MSTDTIELLKIARRIFALNTECDEYSRLAKEDLGQPTAIFWHSMHDAAKAELSPLYRELRDLAIKCEFPAVIVKASEPAPDMTMVKTHSFPPGGVIVRGH